MTNSSALKYQQAPSMATVLSTSTTNTPPPFPKLKQNQLNSSLVVSPTKPHDFELFIFSSMNVCNICQAKFKSSCQFIGLKCKNCLLNCHEHCLADSLTVNCANDMHDSFTQHSTTNSTTSCIKSLSKSVIDHPAALTSVVLSSSSIGQLDTSMFSVQSTSPSTTPNSHFYKQQNQPAHANYQYFNNPSGKIDTDIGSACSKFILIIFERRYFAYVFVCKS